MIFLLHGSNNYHKKTFISNLKDKYKNYSFLTVDFSEEITFSHLDDIVSQISLFDSSSKIIHIKNFTSSTDSNLLINIIKSYIDIHIFILDTNEKIRSNSKFLKLVSDKKNIIECEKYSSGVLLKLVKAKLDESSVPDSENISNLILERVENDPFYLENEIEKLILLYKIKGDYLNFEKYISNSIDHTIWEYINNISKGKKLDAVKILNSLLNNGENEYMIIAMIIWVLRSIMLVKVFPSKTDFEIAKSFGYNPYSIKNIRQVVGNYSLDKVRYLYQKIIDLDYKIKEGIIDPKLGIILYSLAF